MRCPALECSSWFRPCDGCVRLVMLPTLVNSLFSNFRSVHLGYGLNDAFSPGAGFEPATDLSVTYFQYAALGHSAIPPKR